MQKKKSYISPELTEHKIDNEISLIMMTDETTPPDKPRGAAMNPNSFEENPFSKKK